MVKFQRIRLLWIFGVILLILWACQDEKTVGTSIKPHQQPTQDDALLKRLSGKIVFQSDRSGNWDIYVMNVDGGNLVQLTDEPAEDGYPVWSPDGEKIAFESDREGQFDIYVMNADGTNLQRITHHPANDRSPAWSPDGKKIAFDSDRESNIELYVMNADGSGVSSLTRTIGKNILPAWAPDGRQMAYTGNRYLGWNVYVMKIDKTDDKRITDGHGACRPDWSPNSRKIAYVSQKADGKGDIWLMNPDGSEETQLTYDEFNYDYYPEWSPDGKYLAYAKTSDKNTGNWELYVISADGTEQVRLTNHPARDKFPNWAIGNVPDELVLRQKFVYETEHSPHQIGEPKKDQEASGTQALYASASGNAGFLVYGPYQSYEPADYVASFRLKTDRTDLDEPVVTIEVATDTGKTVLTQRELKGIDFLQNNQYQDFQLPFSLKESRILEFRVYFFARANIWVDKITVTIKTRKPN